VIVYRESVDNVEANQLTGFFVNWPNPPTPETHHKILVHSDAIVLAVDSESSRVVGYITAITDHVLAAFIPHLEVLPEYQKQGIGRELVNRMVVRLRDLYMIDLLCDPDVEVFYESLGFRKSGGMSVRNYENQPGAERPVLMEGTRA
jgi:ribosomal protein S18 acetylase RimI-like enzyme